MSERQAKIKRKNEPETEQVKKKKGSVLSSCITAILIIAFLGLGGYALKDNIKAMLPERPEKEKTVSDLAKEKEMTVDEFIKEYGLDKEEVTKKTTESEVMSKITAENYAKYNDQTLEELFEQYEIKDVAGNMLWQDAYMRMPISKYAETVGMTFEDLKEQAGFPDEITEEMTLVEVEDIMAAQQEETEDTGSDEAE